MTAKIRNVSGEDRTLPGQGDRLVLAGQVLEVPEEEVYSFTQQESIWAPVGKVSELHDAGQAAYEERLLEQDGPPVEVLENDQPVEDTPADDTDEKKD